MYTIMIADDEQLERQALRYIIEKNCPQLQIVAEAGDGIKAVELACDKNPDIILMDIRMPGKTGLEAAMTIRKALPDTLIVMQTAFDEFDYAKQALTAGAVEYLLKPLRPKELVQTLETVVAKVEQHKLKQKQDLELRKTLADAMPFIQMSFVFDLISGNVRDRAHYRERADFLGLKTDPAVVMVADIYNLMQLTQSEGELKRQLIKQQVYQHIRDMLGSQALVAPFGSDDVVILFGPLTAGEGQAAVEEVKQHARVICDSVRQKLGVSLTIGIGRLYRDPLDIHKSYLEAGTVLRQRFYYSETQVAYIDDISELSEVPMYYPFHYERDLLEKVRCGERQQAKDALRQLLHEIFTKQANMETVKASVLELLIVLSRAAVEGGASLAQLTLHNLASITRLLDCVSHAQIQQWVFDALDQYMDNMLDNRGTLSVRVINRACEYIVKNCHKNLSLEDVAQSVHLSPFYFSRLFKTEKGCNFVDFLTKVRIEKAKQLLHNPDLTVARIAVESGYGDASYFSRVFRQEVGVTPNQYRNSLS